MKKKCLAFLGLVAPGAVFAEGTAYTVPPEVTTAIQELEGAATTLTGSFIPYIKTVGLTFLGITLIVAVVGLLRWAIRKATPGSRG